MRLVNRNYNKKPGRSFRSAGFTELHAKLNLSNARLRRRYWILINETKSCRITEYQLQLNSMPGLVQPLLLPASLILHWYNSLLPPAIVRYHLKIRRKTESFL